jgi:predicted O-methyltransferase YrrM
MASFTRQLNSLTASFQACGRLLCFLRDYQQPRSAMLLGPACGFAGAACYP